MPCSDEVSLVIGSQTAEKRSPIDDIGVGGYGQSFGDFRCDQDVMVVLLQVVAIVVMIMIIVTEGTPSQGLRGG